MNEARNNPNAVAKQDGKRTGFAKEIDDIAVVVKLAQIGIEALKQLSDDEKETAGKEFVEYLLSNGPFVIGKFQGVAEYLFGKAKSQQSHNE